MKSCLYIVIFILIVTVVGVVVFYNAQTIDDIQSETVKNSEKNLSKNITTDSGKKMTIGQTEAFDGHEIQEVREVDENLNEMRITHDSYGSLDGNPGTVQINTQDWKIERNDLADISFSYPNNAILISEDGCYRVEYEKGFVILLVPTAKVNENSDDRCGARTGVGVIPESAEFDDYLTFKDEKRKFSGFRAVFEKITEFEDGHKELKISYDFHHLSSYMEGYCDNNERCMTVGYGIYEWDLDEKISKEELDETMDTLRTIVESIE